MKFTKAELEAKLRPHKIRYPKKRYVETRIIKRPKQVVIEKKKEEEEKKKREEEARRPHVVVVPPELIEFLKLHTRQTMLVRGAAGTGKTTLVLELLRELGGVGVYVTTRVAPDEIYTDFPWIREHVPKENIIDATKPYKSTHVIEDLTDGYAALPDALKNVYDIIKNTSHSTVVVDSWEAVVESLKTTKGDFSKEVWTQEALELELMNQIKSKNANLILVLERVEPTRLDYLVDGVLSIIDTELDGRPIRELELNKLRGVRRQQKRYLITLEDGRYRAFTPFKEPEIITASEWQPVEELHPSRYSSGTEVMDNLLGGGGYLYRSFIVFEAQDVVPNRLLLLLLRPTILNFLTYGRKVIMVPMEGMTFDTQYEFLRYLPVTVHSALQIVPADKFKPVVDDDTKLYVLGIDALEHGLTASKVNELIRELIMIQSRQESITIAVIRPGLQVAQHLCNIADIYFTITELDGTYVLYGKKPMTIVHHIELDISRNLPELKLTAIV